MELRGHQPGAIQSLRDGLKAGHRKLLLVSPTGSGKTVMACAIIESFLKRQPDLGVVFVVHRKELAEQTCKTLWEFAQIPSSIYMGSDARFDGARKVQVCGIQTLARRLADGKYVPPAGLVIYDECHHALSGSARKVLEHYDGAILVGVTATPWRKDGQGFGDLFTHLTVAAKTKDLIAQGLLAPYRAKGFFPPDMSSIHCRGGDFVQEEIQSLCDTQQENRIMVDKYEEYAKGLPCIVFPSGCDHSQHLVKEYKDRGYRAAHIDWSTPADERESILEHYKAGDLDILSSVGVLTEGFDAPNAVVCQLARPTCSLSLHIQMIGRVLRISPNKKHAIILDHYGNLTRNGLPDENFAYSLDFTPQKILARKTCTQCYAVVSTWADGHCPECGALQAVREECEGAGSAPKLKVDKVTTLDLEEIRALRERFKSQNSDSAERSDEELHLVVNASREAKGREYLRLKAVQRASNGKLSDHFPQGAFRGTFGHWPGFATKYLSSLTPADKPFLPLKTRGRNDNTNKLD